MNYGIFKSVNIECDRGKSRSQIDVNVHLEEKRKYFVGSMGAETNNQEVLGKIGCGMRNFGGRAECLSFEASGSGQNENHMTTDSFFVTKTMFKLTFQKPRLLASQQRMIMQITRREENKIKNSSYKEDIQSFNLSVVDENFIHKLSYICDLRMLHPTKRDDGTCPSPSILQEGSEPSLKSALSYEYIENSENKLIIPTHGTKKLINVELAGLGGNVQFLRTIFSCTHHVTLGVGILNIGLHCGFVSTLLNLVDRFKINTTKWLTNRRLQINDRLQIPGKLLHRGYHYGKIGVMDEKDYLNGDAMFVTGLSYTFPFGYTGLAGHLFLTAGNVQLIDVKQSIIDNFSKAIMYTMF